MFMLFMSLYLQSFFILIMHPVLMPRPTARKDPAWKYAIELPTPGDIYNKLLIIFEFFSILHETSASHRLMAYTLPHLSNHLDTCRSLLETCSQAMG